jgi:hypothetical protein
MNAASVATVEPSLSPRFIDNGDGTITDTASGLMWSKATISAERVTHAAAEKICADLDLAGHKDWRLPTVEELFLIADRTRQNPSIDTAAFPDTQADWYWSSTITAWSSDLAWFVSFHGGGYGNLHRGNHGAYVRAVRSVPSGQ